jgi:hypothetical protein
LELPSISVAAFGDAGNPSSKQKKDAHGAFPSPWHLGPSTMCCGRERLFAARSPARRTELSASSLMKEARRELERQGFMATKTRGGHWRFEHPDMDGPVFTADTPSDQRGLRA